MGALDFAGGTVVHINAGIAALAVVLVLGRRKGWPDEQMPPHSLPLTLLGTGILWFGWFGFNAGSALAANGLAAQAFINTNIAAAAAMLGWLVVERLKGGHATTLGAASGAVAGLVAITPCAGFVGGLSPIIIGFVAGVRLLPGHPAQVPLRLRRRPRRDRRPPRRRHRSGRCSSACSPTRRSTPTSAPTACSSAAASGSSVTRRWRCWPRWPGRASSRSSWPR